MAKKEIKKTDKVEIIVGAKPTDDVVMSQTLRNKVAEIKEEETKEAVSVVAPKNEKLQTQRMVKVMLSRPHRCHVGGEWYSFQANKQYNVPEQVKAILMGANLLLPL